MTMKEPLESLEGLPDETLIRCGKCGHINTRDTFLMWCEDCVDEHEICWECGTMYPELYLADTPH